MWYGWLCHSRSSAGQFFHTVNCCNYHFTSDSVGKLLENPCNVWTPLNPTLLLKAYTHFSQKNFKKFLTLLKNCQCKHNKSKKALNHNTTLFVDKNHSYLDFLLKQQTFTQSLVAWLNIFAPLVWGLIDGLKRKILKKQACCAGHRHKTFLRLRMPWTCAN